MDLVETADDFVLRADLPGMRQEDVKIEVEDNVLTVSGERAAEHEAREDGLPPARAGVRALLAVAHAPEGRRPEAVSAAFTDGVLEVRIPKPTQSKPRRIEIAVGGNGEPKTIEGSGTPA